MVIAQNRMHLHRLVLEIDVFRLTMIPIPLKTMMVVVRSRRLHRYHLVGPVTMNLIIPLTREDLQRE